MHENGSLKKHTGWPPTTTKQPPHILENVFCVCVCVRSAMAKLIFVVPTEGLLRPENEREIAAEKKGTSHRPG